MKKLYKFDDVDILFTPVSVIKVVKSEVLKTCKETKCLVQVRKFREVASARDIASCGFTRGSGRRGV